MVMFGLYGSVTLAVLECSSDGEGVTSCESVSDGTLDADTVPDAGSRVSESVTESDEETLAVLEDVMFSEDVPVALGVDVARDGDRSTVFVTVCDVDRVSESSPDCVMSVFVSESVLDFIAERLLVARVRVRELLRVMLLSLDDVSDTDIDLEYETVWLRSGDGDVVNVEVGSLEMLSREVLMVAVAEKDVDATTDTECE